MTEIKSIIIEGYASVFDHIDTHGDVTKKGCFVDELKTYPYRSMLFGHDATRVLGHWLDMFEDDKGLRVLGCVTDKQAIQLVTCKALLGLSIGYSATDINQKNDHRNLKGIWLQEVSITPIPCNRHALILGCDAWNEGMDDDRFGVKK